MKLWKQRLATDGDGKDQQGPVSPLTGLAIRAISLRRQQSQIHVLAGKYSVR